MKIPVITVLMPVYNGEKYLKEAVESILNQTFTDFEFLIIDDGSADDSAKIIRNYRDPRIVFVQHEKNLGLISTLNQGIELAKGKYLARMDADDISKKERLQTQFDFMEKHQEVSVCGTWAKGINAEGKVISHLKAPSGLLIRYNYWKPSPIIHPTAFIRMLAIKKYRFDKRALHAEDYDFWLQVAKESQLHNIKQYLFDYRIHGESISARNRDEQLRSSYQSFVKYINSGKKINFQEFKSLCSLDFNCDVKDRYLAYKKIQRELGIPSYLLLSDNFFYLLKRKIYGKK